MKKTRPGAAGAASARVDLAPVAQSAPRTEHRSRRDRLDRLEHGRSAAQGPRAYRVEAVTAHSNAAALAKLARELGARFAAVADQALYAELKAELSGSGSRRPPARPQSSKRRSARPNG